MKCIKCLVSYSGWKKGQIERLGDEHAAILVYDGRWVYCPKHEWKEARRG